MGEWLALEQELQDLLAERWGEEAPAPNGSGRAPTVQDRSLRARSIVRQALEARKDQAALHSRPFPAAGEQELILERVVRSAFSRAPGLDALLALDGGVTDIFVNGCDDVRATYADGRVERLAPLAPDDDRLIELVQTLARRGGHLEREFTPARPFLDLELPDGSRLAAAAWVTARPYIAIRRHLLVDADQDQLVERGMFDAGLASLFRALVRARRNIMIAGGAGVGKTTLLRALLHECDPDERIVVLEQEPELHLASSPERHNHVLLFMERTSNTEGFGAVSLADLSRAIKRFAPQRIVVGEVRGPEVIDMIEALTQGIAGGLCTIHADSSLDVFPRIPVYARAGGRDWRDSDVLKLAALALDVVVFVSKNRSGRRVVSEVRWIQRYDRSTDDIVTDEWFCAGPDRRAVRHPDSPIPVAGGDELVEHGYDPSLHEGAAW